MIFKQRIAVISDTHGHLDPALVKAIKGADLIIHAGDLDGPKVLKALGALAPVLAVRGNMDRGSWANPLRIAEMDDLGGILFYVIHDLAGMDIDPVSIQVGVVISGHTHRPLVEEKEGVLFLNPGSATLPRGGFPPTFAWLNLGENGPEVQIINL